MNELLNITINENHEPIMSARELHEFLEVNTKYADWFPRMTEYGFIENQDFVLVSQKRATNNPRNPETEYTDHIIKLDMAKEIAMIQGQKKERSPVSILFKSKKSGTVRKRLWPELLKWQMIRFINLMRGSKLTGLKLNFLMQ